MFKYNKEELLGSIVDKGYNFPVSSNKEHLMNKKIDYKILLLVTLFSNKQTEEDFYENGTEEQYRYIYRNKLAHYQELVENVSGLKINSIYKAINKMTKIEDNKIIELNKTEQGCIQYIIKYCTNQREFVTIDTNIMLELIDNFDSNAIKVYTLFNYMCREKERQITQEWILKQIGLNAKSNKNKQMITDITNKLEKHGLISKRTITSEIKKRITYYKVKSI